MTRRAVAIAFMTTLLAGPSVVAEAAGAPQRCQARKLRNAAGCPVCWLNAEAKSVLKATSPDFTKCEERLWIHQRLTDSTFGPDVCPTHGDVVAVEAQMIRDAADLDTLLAGGTVLSCGPNAVPLELPASGQVVSYHPGDDGEAQAGAPLQFADNGDGTITDVNTGLMWEKLSDDGSLHDKDTDFLQWTGAVDFKIALLNGGSFAGYGDWRLPNVKELHSIIDYSNPPGPTPAHAVVHPAFDSGCSPGCAVTTCSCAASSFHLSSTVVAADPNSSWGVYFDSGVVSNGTAGRVRAVRGGS